MLAPHVIIIIGPKDTLGSELNIFKNGSNALYKLLNKYKVIDIIKLIIKHKVNDKNISLIVINICLNNKLSKYKL